MYENFFRIFLYFFSSLSFGWNVNFVESEQESRLNSSEGKTKLNHEKFLLKAFLLAFQLLRCERQQKQQLVEKAVVQMCVCVRDCRDVLRCFLSVSAPRSILCFAVCSWMKRSEKCENLSLFLFLLHVRCCKDGELLAHKKAQTRSDFHDGNFMSLRNLFKWFEIFDFIEKSSTNLRCAEANQRGLFCNCCGKH